MRFQLADKSEYKEKWIPTDKHNYLLVLIRTEEKEKERTA